jgi:hypothetical protein
MEHEAAARVGALLRAPQCQESLHISVVAPVNHLIVLMSKIGTLFALF